MRTITQQSGRLRSWRIIPYLLLILIFNRFMISGSAQPENTLVVFAASSLTDALIEIGEVFEEQYPDTKIIFNFAGSSTLATQLIEGASADVFASGNELQMDRVVEEGEIVADDVLMFAQNTLALILPFDNPAQIESVEDLSEPGILLVVAAPFVPIRGYTDFLLHNLQSAYGNQYYDRVTQNIVSEEANVRQIVARITLGEADAGIVYYSDVTPEIVDKVSIIEIPAIYNPVASYPIAPTTNAANPKQAAQFIDFVLSDVGQAILVRWGFCSLPEMQAEITPEPSEDIEVVCHHNRAGDNEDR